MKMYKIMLSALLLLVSVTVAHGYYDDEATSHIDSEVEPVSIYHLLGNEADYDGKYISLIGIIALEFEEHILYPDPYSYCMLRLKSGISVDLSGTDIKEEEKTGWTGDTVIITGKFIDLSKI